ncbi:MAG TPA: hypothetical protein VFG68_20825, partial [Fimbriiglobus sp.]|nr:hypothetical protein [Fimbriiglobus sp.]
MRVLRVADVPDNRTGGMSRAMYLAGDALARLGHTVEYAFADHLGPAPAKVRRFVIPWRVPALVRRWSRLRGRYDVVEVHEPLSAGYCL